MRTPCGLAAIVATACSGTANTPPDAAIAVDAAAPIDAPYGSAFDVHVFDVGSTAAVVGGRVCVVGQAACGTTDASGNTSVTAMGTRGDMRFAFVSTAAGHLATVELARIFLQLDVEEYTVPSTIGLLADADAHALFTSAGFADPAASTGFIRVTVLDGVTTGAEVGATLSLDGSASAPVYLDGSGQPDAALTAIGSGGGVLLGGVSPGPFSLTVHVPHKACIDQAFGWVGSGSSAVSGVVVAGALTDGIVLACYGDGT